MEASRWASNGKAMSAKSIAERLANLVMGAQHKEPEELTDLERIAIAVLGGADYEFTDTGLRVTSAFGIQKIDGRFIVSLRRV